jgi:hypothetical protein
MKKCAHCGLLNDAAAAACTNCGGKDFRLKPPERRRPEVEEERPRPAPAPLAGQRQGEIVTLKCRTPGEAYLVCQSLGSSNATAVLPDEEQILAQYKRHGYVEVQVPADAYDSNDDLRSVVGLPGSCGPDQKPPVYKLQLFEIVSALFLGFFFFPGAVVFWSLVDRCIKRGERWKIRRLCVLFFIGLSSCGLLFFGWLIMRNLSKP